MLLLLLLPLLWTWWPPKHDAVLDSWWKDRLWTSCSVWGTLLVRRKADCSIIITFGICRCQQVRTMNDPYFLSLSHVACTDGDSTCILTGFRISDWWSKKSRHSERTQPRWNWQSSVIYLLRKILPLDRQGWQIGCRPFRIDGSYLGIDPVSSGPSLSEEKKPGDLASMLTLTLITWLKSPMTATRQQLVRTVEM